MKDVVSWNQHRQDVSEAFSALHAQKKGTKKLVVAPEVAVISPDLRADWAQYIKARFGD